MPNIKSASKRLRSDAKRTERNQAVLSELKTLTRNYRKLVQAEPEKAVEYQKTLFHKIDKAASNGAIPKKRADRKKSRAAVLLTNKAS